MLAPTMEDPVRLRRLCILAIAQHEDDVLNLKTAEHIEGPRLQRRKNRRRRQYLTKSSILGRQEFGLYDELMDELRQEGVCFFTNFMPMPPDIFDEIIGRIRGRLTKKHISYLSSHQTWPQTCGDTATFGLWI